MPNQSPAVNASNSAAPAADPAEHWVFGYGSLMWRPGFDFVERRPALLIGAHRALCVLSHVHRGTPQLPGLVLGLDLGGQCRGVAFRVAPAAWAETLAYLRAREQATRAYREVMRRVRLLGAAERDVRALTYVADRSHPQYAGAMTPDHQLELVRQGYGQSGANRDYVLATVRELEALGLRDPVLHWLAERL